MIKLKHIKLFIFALGFLSTFEYSNAMQKDARPGYVWHPGFMVNGQWVEGVWAKQENYQAEVEKFYGDARQNNPSDGSPFGYHSLHGNPTIVSPQTDQSATAFTSAISEQAVESDSSQEDESYSDDETTSQFNDSRQSGSQQSSGIDFKNESKNGFFSKISLRKIRNFFRFGKTEESVQSEQSQPSLYPSIDNLTTEGSVRKSNNIKKTFFSDKFLADPRVQNFLNLFSKYSEATFEKASIVAVISKEYGFNKPVELLDKHIIRNLFVFMGNFLSNLGCDRTSSKLYSWSEYSRIVSRDAVIGVYCAALIYCVYKIYKMRKDKKDKKSKTDKSSDKKESHKKSDKDLEDQDEDPLAVFQDLQNELAANED